MVFCTQYKPTFLIILDGFGYRAETQGNAVALARKPFFDYVLQHYPHAILQASGKAVGLAPGLVGNSEVGHFTIGAGRTVLQDLSRISNAIHEGSFLENKTLLELICLLKKKQKKLHLIGLVSDGNVHASLDHIHALIDAADRNNFKHIIVHAIIDGRDTPAKSAAQYLQVIEKKLRDCKMPPIASIHGRFFAMDRDHNWQRTQLSYNTLTTQQEVSFTHWYDALHYYYDQNITDEFIPPTQLKPVSIIQNDDGLFFFNIRPDRIVQLIEPFINNHFNHFAIKNMHVSNCLTFVDYAMPDIRVKSLFSGLHIKNTLKQILSQANKKILSIAESEKYRHVTYFFNGNSTQSFLQEDTILIPSLIKKNYVDNPCMSAHEITQTVIDAFQKEVYDFFLINYANADMVGHSGNLEATIKAIECLDKELSILWHAIEKNAPTMYITADHGNAEETLQSDLHHPKTSHTTNPVYFCMVQKSLSPALKLPLKSLADIAPFILGNMQIAVPEQMIGGF